MNDDLQLKFKFWIEKSNGESILGEGKWMLLKAIKETGSLQAAVNQLGYTYRQTWENLKKIESKLGFPLIEKTRGGEKGGHTILTAEGEKMVYFFDHLYERASPEINKLFEDMISSLQQLKQHE
jgi:molybdate transport system regulatory protein